MKNDDPQKEARGDITRTAKRFVAVIIGVGALVQSVQALIDLVRVFLD